MYGTVRPLRLAVHVSLLAAALTLLSPCTPRAQSSQSSQSSQEARDAQNARKASIENRHGALNDLERLKNRPRANARDARLSYREIAEDFKQLQLSNYSLVQAAQPGVQLDYAQIKKQAAEVEKRALSLEAHLALPKPDRSRQADTRDKAVTPDGLRPAIASLDASLNSFVRNPYFRRPEVADFEQMSEAGRDLAEVIALAKRIRKCAAGLGEAVGGRKK